MSLYSYSTENDLTFVGSFAYMGLLSIIIASVINLFFSSNSLDFTISLAGLAIFTIMTAYDTQKLKSIYYGMDGNTVKATNLAIYGPLLYTLNLLISL